MHLIRLLLLLLATAPTMAQFPSTLELRLTVWDGSAMDGSQTLTVRIYDQLVGGSPLFVEDVDAVVASGLAVVTIGNTVPLSPLVFRVGSLFVGASIAGLPERIPRAPCTPVALAGMAQYALIARALAPEVTGVVTSLNEIAGGVSITAGSGLRVDRNGRTLTVSRTGTVVEQGRIQGNGTSFEYVITPTTIVKSDMYVTFRVGSGTTTIQAATDINVASNTIRFIAAAPLLGTEFIEWQLRE